MGMDVNFKINRKLLIEAKFSAGWLERSLIESDRSSDEQTILPSLEASFPTV